MFSVRDAAPSDAPSMAAVNVAAWRAAYEGLVPADFLRALSVEERTAGWRDRFRDPELLHAYIAEAGEGIVGYAITTTPRDRDVEASTTAELKAMYLLPTAWGKGAGRALMERALDDLRAGSFEQVVLWVLEANERARRFYERDGWRTDGARAGCFHVSGAPAVRYRRPL